MDFFGYTPSTEFTVFFGLMLVCLIIQIVYYSIYLKITKRDNKEFITEKFPVSVIICARNEAINLQKNLPLILEQDYSDFEVVVVNDCSEDDTEMIIAGLRQRYKHLRSTTINKDKKFSHGKKLALTIGIKSAKHDCVLLTDADCKPVSKYWLYNMQHNFSNETDLVIGYGGYRLRKGLLDKFIRFDTLFIAMNYLSLTLAGKPYMGIGRNLAYRKQLFFDNKGFSRHSNLLSGDDDLFVNETASKHNVRVELNPDSFTVSEPVKKWGRWLLQKKRHLTTFPLYSSKSKFYIGMEINSRLIFYASFVWLLILNQEIYFVLGAFAIRLIYQLIVIKSVMKRLNEKYLLLFSPMMDLLIPFINFILIISNNIGSKNNKW